MNIKIQSILYTICCGLVKCGCSVYLDFYSSLLDLFLNTEAEQTFLIQLACDANGYLPTEKAEKAGHYSAYISSGKVGHVGGDMYVRHAINEIAKMFEEN